MSEKYTLLLVAVLSALLVLNAVELALLLNRECEVKVYVVPVRWYPWPILPVDKVRPLSISVGRGECLALLEKPINASLGTVRVTTDRGAIVELDLSHSENFFVKCKVVEGVVKPGDYFQAEITLGVLKVR